MTTSNRTFRPGQYLFREGEPPQSLFLIQKGSVGIRKTKGMAHVELARLYTNEVVGELSFFDRQPRSASAVALNEVEALEITFEGLDKVYQGVPDYFRTIMASVADRLRKADDTIRRLQKHRVDDESTADEARELGLTEGEPSSAADVLAATADIDPQALGKKQG